MCICSDCEELLGGLDAVAGDGLLIAVADACVPIVVLQVFYDEFLADVDHFVDGLVGQVDKLHGELVWADSQYLALLVELQSRDWAAVVADLHVYFGDVQPVHL